MKPKSSAVNDQILDEASEWFVEFRAGDVDTGARQRFDEWLRRSPEHIRAYIEVARVYVELPPPPDTIGEIDVAALIAYGNSGANLVPLNVHARITEESRAGETARVHGRDSYRGRWRALTAAALTGLVGISGALVWQAQRFPSYSTDIGERRSVELSDGSMVDLNGRSKLRVEFSGAQRRVDLLQGQALFQVAKDKARPFIVRSGEAIVRAVGTQFDVDRKTSGTTVTVLEGRVVVYSGVPAVTSTNTSSGSVATEAGSAGDGVAAARDPKSRDSTGTAPELPSDLAPPSDTGSAVFVAAGEQVTVTAQSLASPEHADVAAATAWKQRKLIFEGTKLSDVVEEFNRNNRRRLVIESRELANYLVSGVYSSKDPASLVRFLRVQPGFKITESDTEVRIAAK